MSMHLPRRLMATALLAALGILPSAVAAPAKPEADLLDRPAQVSSRAARSVLLALSRADKRLVAVGEQGLILLSDDNGASWRQAKVPTSVALTNVHFITPKVGWAVGHGGIVLKSGDAGETWVRQLDGRKAAQIELDAAKADAGPTAEKRRRDAERLAAEGPDKPLLGVHFSDENNGLVVGAYGLIYGTRDGGATWQSLKPALDNPKGRHLYAIHASGSGLYVTGEQGALYRSSDAGRSFTEVKTPYVGTYFGALTAPGGEIVVYGLRGNAWRSTDQGASWQKVDTGLPVTLTAGARLADGSLILVDETGRVLQSRDAGTTFKPVPVAQPSPFTGVAETTDGNLTLSGVRGVSRLPLKTNIAERKQ